MLFLSAQDLTELQVGCVEPSGELSGLERRASRPETFLRDLSEYLKRHAKSWKDFDGVLVVAGPGSFTSTRVIVTIANGLAFALKIPVFSLKNPGRLSPEALLKTWKRPFALPFFSYKKFVMPIYDRPPHITWPGDK